MSLPVNQFTLNQLDALKYLREGGFIKVKGKHIEYVGKPTQFKAQRNTFTSLHKRGLLRLDHSDEEGNDYYTLRKDEK